MSHVFSWKQKDYKMLGFSFYAPTPQSISSVWPCDCLPIHMSVNFNLVLTFNLYKVCVHISSAYSFGHFQSLACDLDSVTPDDQGKGCIHYFFSNLQYTFHQSLTF